MLLLWLWLLLLPWMLSLLLATPPTRYSTANQICYTFNPLSGELVSEFVLFWLGRHVVMLNPSVQNRCCAV